MIELAIRLLGFLKRLENSDDLLHAAVLIVATSIPDTIIVELRDLLVFASRSIPIARQAAIQ